MATLKRSVRILLNGGDNMLGRGVQLSCQHQSPGDAEITDSMPASYYLKSALHPGHDSRTDLDLDEIRDLNRQGLYLWGDYLGLRFGQPPDLRILNLETAVTTTIDNDDVPGQKGINYHLHCDNLPELLQAFAAETHGGTSPSPFVIAFANNHALDFGRRAFEEESLPLLRRQFKMAGAGADFADAARPVTIEVGESRLQTFALATGCSGTPSSWAALENRSGLIYLPALRSEVDVDRAVEICKHVFNPYNDERGQIRIVSVHWGPNWAYRYSGHDGQLYRQMFAHRLIEECSVDLIYGHSSHHIRGFERFRHRLIVYGAGDLINDYEGFENPGDEVYPKFGAWIVVDLVPVHGELSQVRLIPCFMDRLRLTRLRPDRTIWHPPTRSRRSVQQGAADLCAFLNKISSVDVGKSNGMPVSVQFRVVNDDNDLPVLEMNI